MVVRQCTLEALVMLPDAGFWRGKRVLLTGHSGFKGSWLTLWLQRMGAQVTGLSLPPASAPNLPALLGDGAWQPDQRCDIRDAAALYRRMHTARPEVIFHLAAQALVRAGYDQPLDTFATNVMGTAHVLEAVRSCPEVRVVVVATTDKVYRNEEAHYPYREHDALGGHDPYSASKAAAEMVIGAYRASFLQEKGVALAAARAGNVIGGGDWSADRLIPDAMRAWSAGEPLVVRRPDAIRPWQHVLEPLGAYLALAHKLWDQPELADAYNFGPHTDDGTTVREVVQWAQAAYGKGEVAWGDGKGGAHEAAWLGLEVAKAHRVLGVQPCWSVSQAVRRSVVWYRQLAKGVNARALCLADIADFEMQRQP